MQKLYIILLCLFACSLLFILVYSIAQIQLVFRYLKGSKHKVKNRDGFQPKVTVQLPIYNEEYVSKRLLKAITTLNYPKELLEIQVLDDSTDDTQEILKNEVQLYREKGFDITYIHRVDRKGFKAGALKEGLKKSDAEFVCIFDADFVPDPEYINNTVSYFQDDEIGMVQSCWEHLNKNYSLLTKLQAFGLDAHFSVEQVGRNAENNFINFNGTAGMWRKSCIIDAGNWEADTLTEDLDLSYRAQLKGWKFIYLEDLKSPAELPPVMSALRSQQFRWTKGGAETARKHLINVLKSSKSLSDKWHGTFHLLNSCIFIGIFLSAMISVPILILKQDFPEFDKVFILASVFLFSFFSISALYAVSSVNKFESSSKGWYYFITHYPLFLSFSMGLSFHNAVAVFEGLIGKKSPFVRTPKFNLENNNNWHKNNYISKNLKGYSIVEGLLFLYFGYGLFLAIKHFDYSLLFFHILLFSGYGMVFYYSIIQRR